MVSSDLIRVAYTTQSAAVIQWFFSSPFHNTYTHIMHVNEYVLRPTPNKFHFRRHTAHTIKNIENCVMYLMGGNTQAGNDDSQINCVIEPFYFIDGFNEFWWQFSAADTPSLCVSPFRSFFPYFCTARIRHHHFSLELPLNQRRRRLPMFPLQFFSWNLPSDSLQMMWKPRENVTKMLVN